MSRLGNILSKLASNACIEKGTSGIWTYKKYADGTAECWGNHVQSITSWTQWGGLYYSNPYNTQVSYPTGLFIAEPVLTATQRGGMSDAFLISGMSGDANKTTAFYFGRGVNGGADTKTIYFHAIGKWK